jgi:hypothetical protein
MPINPNSPKYPEIDPTLLPGVPGQRGVQLVVLVLSVLMVLLDQQVLQV